MENSKCLIPAYGLLTEQQIALINQSSNIIHHKPGEIIFMSGRPVSHLIFVQSGLVKLFKPLEEKHEVILDMLTPGNFVGLTALFYEDLYPYSANAVESSELVFINVQAIRKIMTENGAYSVKIMTLLSSRVMYLIEKMMAISRKQVTGRLAELLLHLSRNIYCSDTFTLPFSRQEIADMVQTTKETISRTLTEFKNDKIIELEDRKVTLKSIELLDILNKIG
ncbi:MAG: Crp/Fnr family transcriptional regulator [Bacteroidales bacterium]|nr:Crp/Fnr family transcriptional regulator [Bacteroidales bacterium]